MKQLTDKDIAEMIGAADFAPPPVSVMRNIRRELHLARRIPPSPEPLPRIARLDLHQKTEQQAWDEIMALATSGVRDAIIITGASGILKIKFQQWAAESLLTPHILSWKPINNGSFAVKFHRNKK